jgi:hypothetical protein
MLCGKDYSAVGREGMTNIVYKGNGEVFEGVSGVIGGGGVL